MISTHAKGKYFKRSGRLTSPIFSEDKKYKLLGFISALKRTNIKALPVFFEASYNHWLSIYHPMPLLVCAVLPQIICFTDVRAISHASKTYRRNKRYHQNHVVLKDSVLGCTFKESLKLFFFFFIQRNRQKSCVISNILALHPSQWSQLYPSVFLLGTDVK